MNDQTEYINGIYAALSRGDADGFVEAFAADVERVEHFDTVRSYRGIDDVRAHVVEGRSTWAEGACEPEQFTVVGDSIVVSTHVRVRLRDQTDWIDGHAADVFTFREGKVVRFHTFFDEEQALAWTAAN